MQRQTKRLVMTDGALVPAAVAIAGAACYVRPRRETKQAFTSTVPAVGQGMPTVSATKVI
jgi:hypothetical protein